MNIYVGWPSIILRRGSAGLRGFGRYWPGDRRGRESWRGCRAPAVTRVRRVAPVAMGLLGADHVKSSASGRP